jgi:hypothetical protein
VSAYSVGQTTDGSWCWWENWQSIVMPVRRTRPATPEEAGLMDKMVWNTDTPDDVARLLALLPEDADAQ